MVLTLRDLWLGLGRRAQNFYWSVNLNQLMPAKTESRGDNLAIWIIAELNASHQRIDGIEAFSWSWIQLEHWRQVSHWKPGKNANCVCLFSKCSGEMFVSVYLGHYCETNTRLVLTQNSNNIDIITSKQNFTSFHYNISRQALLGLGI